MHGVRRLQLCVLTGVLTSGVAKCLPNHSQTRLLNNVTLDGANMPVGFWQFSQSSQRFVSQVASILVEEVLGYQTQLTEPVSGSERAVWALAGCSEGLPCNASSAPPAVVHAAMEFTVGSESDQLLQREDLIPLHRRPKDIGPIGYGNTKNMFVPGEVVDAAYGAQGLGLDVFRFYDSPHFDVSPYFDDPFSISNSLLNPCNATLNFQLQSVMDEYQGFFPWDTVSLKEYVDGDGNRKLMTRCDDGYRWLSPACRRDTSKCIPVITTERGSSVNIIMQRATFYNMSVALMAGRTRDVYGYIVRNFRTVAYWWKPDATFAEMDMREITFPPHRKLEWADGFRVSSTAGTVSTTLVHHDLELVAPRIFKLLQNIEFVMEEVMMIMSSERDAACQYLRTTSRWQQWIPGPANCQPGWGGFTSDDTYALRPEDAERCTQCPAGYVSLVNLSGSAPLRTCSLCPRGAISAEPGSLECVRCGPGTHAVVGNTQCESCEEGHFCEGGEHMESCPALFTSRVGGASAKDCVVTNSMLLLYALFAVLVSIASYLMLLGAARYVVPLEDVTLEKEGVVVRTSVEHCLMWRVGGPRIVFTNTSVPWLDKPQDAEKKQFFYIASVLDSRCFRLLKTSGDAEHRVTEASCGEMRVPFPWCLTWVTFLRVPVLCWEALCLAGCWAVASTTAPPVELLLGALLAGLVLGVAAAFTWSRRATRTKMDKLLRDFEPKVYKSNPNPRSCPPGPGRALRAGDLQDLLGQFHGWIRMDRSMHWLCPNVVLKLTKKRRLSYAELVGPRQADWFVSHCWANSFSNFVRAIQKHALSFSASADALTAPGLGTSWRSVAYWVCTFSNNQWRLSEELGSSWQETSFYKTLCSAGCRGTALIFDVFAQPLERSWCLFELFHTARRKQSQASFEGLMLCTETGVLNTGNCSMDSAMALASALASLNLREAKASVLEDKLMIDRLVEQEDGGFDAVTHFLRTELQHSLNTAKRHFQEEMAKLERRVSAAEGAAEGAKGLDADESNPAAEPTLMASL